jgi:hypothetical protein
VKRCSFEKRLSKFTPKKFYEIDSMVLIKWRNFQANLTQYPGTVTTRHYRFVMY